MKKASEYTVADVFRIIDSNDVKHLIHMSASTAGIKDEFQFVAQISEFIYARSLEKLPTTLEMLNRKFGRIASKLGTSARSAVDVLYNGGIVMEIADEKKTAFYSKRAWNDLDKLFKEVGS